MKQFLFIILFQLAITPVVLAQKFISEKSHISFYSKASLEDIEAHTYKSKSIFDIETGGHVFQLHFTNSNPTFERGFITETTGDFFGGDIHFGFNITRTFQLVKK